MSIPYYMAASALIIMVWRFTLSQKPNDFGMMEMIGVFVLGGAIGYFMNSIILALSISFILSLIFN